MASNNMLKGLFCGPRVQGLTYVSQTQSGITDEKSEFSCPEGETITFLAGDLVLGSCVVKDLITPADLVIEVSGDDRKIWNRGVVNLTVFLQSLDKDADPNDIVVLTPEIIAAINKYRYSINFSVGSVIFPTMPAFIELTQELGTSIRSIPAARNTMRRAMHGIRKQANVRIPVRDGSYLSADIFRPIRDGKYPVIVSNGAFGKNFVIGRSTTEEDAKTYETLEDAYFEGTRSHELDMLKLGRFSSIVNPGGAVPEHNSIELDKPEGPPDFETLPPVSILNEVFERANVYDYVPYGYIVAHVEERGCGNSPGYFAQFSKQGVDDYEDVINWLGELDYSNGNVGTFGASYYAMTQYPIASRSPKHLKAMVPIAGDVDSYRNFLYSGGGLFERSENFPIENADDWKGLHWIDEVLKNEFYSEEVYGPNGSLIVSAEPEKIKIPMWIACPIGQTIHSNGSSTAYIESSTKEKKFLLTSEPGIHFWMYNKENTGNFRKFFDKYLKGEDNDIMESDPVKIMVMTGWGGYYWMTAKDWPLPQTDYQKMYLDAKASTYTDEKRTNGYSKLSFNLVDDAEITYDADVKCAPFPLPDVGVCFLSEPFEDDMVIVGHPKFGGWVSSTSSDMELHITLRLIDENGEMVDINVFNGMVENRPVGQGALKVSHRPMDPEKSTIDQPYYLHTKEAYAPLTPGEIVDCEVKMMPTAFRIKKDWRLRVDVNPVGLGYVNFDDAEYRRNSKNTIYTGKDHPSYIQLPIIKA